MRKLIAGVFVAALAFTAGLTADLFYDSFFAETGAPVAPARHSLHVPLRRNCELHGSGMRAQEVPILYGLSMLVPGYREAKRARFPNGEEHVLGGRMVGERKSRLAWVCLECRAARSAWLEEHRVSDGTYIH